MRLGFGIGFWIKWAGGAANYAVQRWSLRCRYGLSNHSAVRFVYRYVI